MKLQIMGTQAECARLAFLLRFGPPELQVLQVDGPYPNRTFYSLVDPDGKAGAGRRLGQRHRA